jgi:beta-glucanase (GH16 family)
MRTRILLLLLIALTLKVDLIFSQEYQLVWSDEFDGAELDTDKWEFQIGNGPPAGWGNNELEYYRKENATVSDGFLTITAKKENYQNFQYTSSRIRTKNKGDWKYGKFEIRAKMPKGKGLWPAIWMLPTDNVYGGWAASGEIDIMEYLGHDTTTVYGTLHYGGAWPNNVHSGKSYTLKSGGFNEDFHTFTLVWEEGRMDWYVDGQLYQTQTHWYTSGHSFPAPFDQRFHLILNLAVGGNWPGNPDGSTKFPQEFVIDYVRVYQRVSTDIEEGNNSGKPSDFYLGQNYPNPFNSQTVIEYQLPKAANVKITLYNIYGQTADVIVDEYHNAGNYKYFYDASKLSSGVYTYSLNAGGRSQSRKLVLIK